MCVYSIYYITIRDIYYIKYDNYINLQLENENCVNLFVYLFVYFETNNEVCTFSILSTYDQD